MKIIFTTGEEDSEYFVKKKNKVWHSRGAWSKECVVHFRNNLKKVCPNGTVMIDTENSDKYSGYIEIKFRNLADEAQFILIQQNITIDFRKNV
jgi:hypothetical protein